MSDLNFFGSDKIPKWSDNAWMMTTSFNTVYLCLRYCAHSFYKEEEGSPAGKRTSKKKKETDSGDEQQASAVGWSG